mgnify:CR=1 FL=1
MTAMKASSPIIRVAVPTPLHRLFDYLPPENSSGRLLPGMRVCIPFGHRSVIGIVVAIIQQSTLPLAKLKYIESVLDAAPIFSDKLLGLLLWAADYYQYPSGEVLLQALPVLLRRGGPVEIEAECFWYLTPEGEQIESEKLKRAPKQWQVLQHLRELKQLQQMDQGLSAHKLGALGIKMQTLKLLKNKNLVVEKKKNKINEINKNLLKGPVLNSDQEKAVAAIIRGQDCFSVFLLQGVTGSGKTEVYLSLLERMLLRSPDQQALVLVPEIGLTPQMVHRFDERLNCRVGVLHSGLSDKQRQQNWLSSKNGDVRVIIGTRSAIFTAFNHLKMIIIDESHDISFKQWDGFKYHARDLAIRRAQLENIPIILGSATPSLSSLYNVQSGRFTALYLPLRAAAAQPPQFKLVNMQGQRIEAGFTVTSLQAIEQHLQQGNQVLVFINRRGYAPIVMCQECGWVAECERCQTAMTLHHQPQRLQCHHCGKNTAMPRQCVQCEHTQLLNVGLGTQRIEQFLQQKFTNKEIARIDRDSTRNKGTLENKLEAIHSGNAQILIGTQMLAKGHDFPNVTLVVVLNVDGGLYSADYAGSERMAQLLLQVAGRAGRAEKPGEVLIQTYHPGHPMLKTLITEGYHAFATQILQEREQTQLPPYRYFALMRSEGVDNTAIKQFLGEVKIILAKPATNIQLLGPLAAPIEKRIGRFRWQLLLSAEKRSSLHQLLKDSLPEIEALKSSRKVRWSIDVDPVDML